MLPPVLSAKMRSKRPSPPQHRFALRSRPRSLSATVPGGPALELVSCPAPQRESAGRPGLGPHMGFCSQSGPHQSYEIENPRVVGEGKRVGRHWPENNVYHPGGKGENQKPHSGCRRPRDPAQGTVNGSIQLQPGGEDREAGPCGHLSPPSLSFGGHSLSVCLSLAPILTPPLSAPIRKDPHSLGDGTTSRQRFPLAL